MIEIKGKEVERMSPWAIPGIRRSEPAKAEPAPLTIDAIAWVVCKYLNVSKAEMLNNSRKKELVLCRRLVGYMAYHNVAGISLKTIANYFNQDHTTIIHNNRQLRDHMEAYEEIAKMVTEIEFFLKLKQESNG